MEREAQGEWDCSNGHGKRDGLNGHGERDGSDGAELGGGLGLEEAYHLLQVLWAVLPPHHSGCPFIICSQSSCMTSQQAEKALCSSFHAPLARLPSSGQEACHPPSAGRKPAMPPSLPCHQASLPPSNGQEACPWHGGSRQHRPPHYQSHASAVTRPICRTRPGRVPHCHR